MTSTRKFWPEEVEMYLESHNGRYPEGRGKKMLEE
jgi:hypothetical protein